MVYITWFQKVKSKIVKILFTNSMIDRFNVYVFVVEYFMRGPS